MSVKKLLSGEDLTRRRFLELGLKSGVVMAAAPSLMGNILDGRGTWSGYKPQTVDPAMLSRVIVKALASGGDFADVYVEDRISRSILMEENKFKSGVFGISKGAGVRVLSGDKTGYAYTEEITEDSMLRAAETASAIARGGKPMGPVGVLRREIRPSYITVDIPLEEAADEKRLEIVRRAHDAALAYDPRIRMASVSYYDEVRGRTIATSEGTLLSDELPLIFFIVQALGVGPNGSHMGRERLSRHSGLEIFDEVRPEDVARACARESVAMLEAREAPAGKMDIVMQNGWGGVLVHEAVGHPLEADNISRKTGAFYGRQGRKVASDVFTMVDSGAIPNARGTTNFDDEGTAMKNNVLIKDGVLQRYLTDVLSARQIGADRTGNGRRESFRCIPIPRMTNTFIDRGKDDPADILASTKSGIYIQSLSGGSVDPTSGIFNFTCREAYLIENGRKTAPVKGATLIGNCLDIIMNVDAVGSDLDFGPGICGKGGQSAEVTAGQPTLRLRGMTVGGSKAR